MISKDDNPILTESERNYLSEIIRPFKGKYIIKIEKTYTFGFRKAFICISLSSIWDTHTKRIKLPYSDTDGMYRGMEFKKEYQPWELGLCELYPWEFGF